MDVTALHHDVGLVRTRTEMKLAAPPAVDPLRALRLYAADALPGEEVQVLGFGRTDRSPLGEELFQVRLRAVPCARGDWLHCVCAVAKGNASRGGSGVCSGDSGGPVLVRGVQVGVTSMGPVQCGASDLGGPPSPSATSVFTALPPYAPLILATINETDAFVAMSRLDSGSDANAISHNLIIIFIKVCFFYINLFY